MNQKLLFARAYEKEAGAEIGTARAPRLAARDGGRLPGALDRRAAIGVAIHEKFGLANDAFRTAKTRHQTVDIDNLIDGVGGTGLLSVAEGRVGDPNIRGHTERDAPMVEGNARHVVVSIYFSVKIRLLDVLQRIVVGHLLQ